MLLFLLLTICFSVAMGRGIIIDPMKSSLGDSGILSKEKALTQEEKVKFQFYYETGCPYSIIIYLTQLEETVKELAPYLDITTYPYGNAKMQLNETQLTIKCQHNQKECYGNMLHACAIDVLVDATRYVPFNACMMNYNIESLTSHDKAADVCGKKLNVDSNSIKECAKNLRGFQLLLHYGIESSKVNYRGVPWWYINGVSKIRGEKRPLKELLCAAFVEPPNVCN